MDRISFHGPGLHSGSSCAVTLIRAPGPVCFWHEGAQISRRELAVQRAEYGVRVAATEGGFGVDLVEHLFAAFAGLSVQSGVAIEVQGPEIPLLDGGSYELACALRSLGAPRGRPLLRVAQAGEVQADRSRYSFEPGDTVEISVQVEFSPAAIGVQRASWNGSAESFMSEIAPARTFGFRSQHAELKAVGRAQFVDPRSVMIIEDDGSIAAPAAPAGAREFARHKLLDLLGDLYLLGGPPIGKIFARRPGHRGNHQATSQALEYGLLERL